MSKPRVVPDNNIRVLWTPQDSIDTARQFHLELDNAQRGVRDDVEIADPVKMRAAFDPQWMFTASRERRARIMDGLAVALLLALMAAMGVVLVVLSAPKAKADIDSTSVAYAAHYADAICTTLAGHPTNSGVQGILAAIQDDGLSTSQAAGAVVLAVSEACPAQTYILQRFADRWASIDEKGTVA